MRIAFVDLVRWDYTIDSVYRIPLGGSQSALCYLAEELARLGYEVYLVNNSTTKGVSRGVTCCPLNATPARLWQSLDVAVLQNAVQPALDLRGLLGPQTRLVVWTQHAHDQPAVQPIADPRVQAVLDAVVLVSNWQRQAYEQYLKLVHCPRQVLQNAAGPRFFELAAEPDPSTEPRPPVLAYTSTPFRGLDVLLDVFPEIRRRVPGCRLRVYSSMRVYQVPAHKDDARHGPLYDRCRATEGVEYVGSVVQSELADELRGASVLAYPNTFPETSCIAVIEALAAGCQVVTSDLGALGETAAGFATLVSPRLTGDAYRGAFTTAVCRALRAAAENSQPYRDQTARQRAYVSEHYSWRRRAVQWSAYLEELLAGRVQAKRWPAA